MNKPLHQLSIAECAREIASGAVSPVELTDACLGVIETHNADVNAFLDVTANLARAAAPTTGRRRWALARRGRVRAGRSSASCPSAPAASGFTL